jgi:hypothetical protein
MPLLRRLVLLLAVSLGSVVLAGPAVAAAPRPSTTSNQLDSVHFRVQYQSDKTKNWAITQTKAGDILAYAERAYAHFISLGFTAPLNDGGLGGDTRIDIYVIDWSAVQGKLGESFWDTDTDQSSGFVTLAGNDQVKGMDLATVAHHVFDVFSFARWTPWRGAQFSDLWLLMASGEWMGYRVNDYGIDHPIALGPEDMALDCRDGAFNKCDLTSSDRNDGHSRWPFFQYLFENYGAAVLQDTLLRGGAGPGTVTALSALSAALVAKGTTLADTYNNWAATDVRGGYAVKALQDAVPTAYTTIQTGSVSGTVYDKKVPVNHLSTRILKFIRGDGGTTRICYPAKLTLSVTIPAGTLSKPFFYWSSGQGTSFVPLSVTGTAASATLAWDTCTWTGAQGYLALPNASTAVDGADFAVKATLAVDTSAPVTTEKPPVPVTVNTPVVPVGSAAVSPTISLFGPELLQLSAGERELRLIVESSGEGVVRATFGSTTLGTASLRGGNNDVRFALPAGIADSLRRSSASGGVLTLTPLSGDSAVSGPAITQRVQLTPAPKAKTVPKAKTAPKAKPAPKTKPKRRK